MSLFQEVLKDKVYVVVDATRLYHSLKFRNGSKSADTCLYIRSNKGLYIQYCGIKLEDHKYDIYTTWHDFHCSLEIRPSKNHHLYLDFKQDAAYSIDFYL